MSGIESINNLSKSKASTVKRTKNQDIDKVKKFCINTSI